MSEEQARDVDFVGGEQWGYRRNPQRRWWTFWRPRFVQDEQEMAFVRMVAEDTTRLPLKINRIK